MKSPDVPLRMGRKTLADKLHKLAMESTRLSFEVRGLSAFVDRHHLIESPHDRLRTAAVELADLATMVRIGTLPIAFNAADAPAEAADPYPLLEAPDGREAEDAEGAGGRRPGRDAGDRRPADLVEAAVLAERETAAERRPDGGDASLERPAAPAEPEFRDDGPGVPAGAVPPARPDPAPALTLWDVFADGDAKDGGELIGEVVGRDASEAGALANRRFGKAKGIDPAKLRVRPSASALPAKPKRARKTTTKTEARP